jgi:hypothetical protein
LLWSHGGPWGEACSCEQGSPVELVPPRVGVSLRCLVLPRDKRESCQTRKVDIRLPEKQNQTPMAQDRSTKIVSMISCIRTSRLSIKNFLSPRVCPALSDTWWHRSYGPTAVPEGSCFLMSEIPLQSVYHHSRRRCLAQLPRAAARQAKKLSDTW